MSANDSIKNNLLDNKTFSSTYMTLFITVYRRLGMLIKALRFLQLFIIELQTR